MRFFPALGLLAAGCVHSGAALNGPEDVARTYALALDEGRVDDAWALSAALDREQFAARYGDAGARKKRALELQLAAGGQPSSSVVLEVRGKAWRVVEATTPVAPLADEQQARELMHHFLAAVSSGDFDTAFADLSASWRARYTPARLKADFESEPAALVRVERIQASLAGRWEVTPAGPQLPLGEGKALKLLREGGALKVAALE